MRPEGVMQPVVIVGWVVPVPVSYYNFVYCPYYDDAFYEAYLLMAEAQDRQNRLFFLKKQLDTLSANQGDPKVLASIRIAMAQLIDEAQLWKAISQELVFMKEFLAAAHCLRRLAELTNDVVAWEQSACYYAGSDEPTEAALAWCNAAYFSDTPKEKAAYLKEAIREYEKVGFLIDVAEKKQELAYLTGDLEDALSARDAFQVLDLTREVKYWDVVIQRLRAGKPMEAILRSDERAASVFRLGAEKFSKQGHHFSAAKYYHEAARYSNEIQDWILAAQSYALARQAYSMIFCYQCAIKLSHDKKAKQTYYLEGANALEGLLKKQPSTDFLKKVLHFYATAIEAEKGAPAVCFEKAAFYCQQLNLFSRASDYFVRLARNYPELASEAWANAADTMEKADFPRERVLSTLEKSIDFSQCRSDGVHRDRFNRVKESYVALEAWVKAARLYEKRAKVTNHPDDWREAAELFEKSENSDKALCCYQAAAKRYREIGPDQCEAEQAEKIAQTLEKAGYPEADFLNYYERSGIAWEKRLVYNSMLDDLNHRSYYEKAIKNFKKAGNFKKVDFLMSMFACRVNKSAERTNKLEDWHAAARAWEEAKRWKEASACWGIASEHPDSSCWSENLFVVVNSVRNNQFTTAERSVFKAIDFSEQLLGSGHDTRFLEEQGLAFQKAAFAMKEKLEQMKEGEDKKRVGAMASKLFLRTHEILHTDDDLIEVAKIDMQLGSFEWAYRRWCQWDTYASHKTPELKLNVYRQEAICLRHLSERSPSDLGVCLRLTFNLSQDPEDARASAKAFADASDYKTAAHRMKDAARISGTHFDWAGGAHYATMAGEHKMVLEFYDNALSALNAFEAHQCHSDEERVSVNQFRAQYLEQVKKIGPLWLAPSLMPNPRKRKAEHESDSGEEESLTKVTKR